MKIFKLAVLFFIFAIIGSLFIAKPARAQSSEVYFSGPKTASLGDTFTLSVFLANTEPVNALDWEISYEKDKLEYIDYNNAGSIVSLWQTLPKKEEDGIIKFSGGMFAPYEGGNGLVIKLRFKTLKESQTTLAVPKADTYVADGKGTRLEIASRLYSMLIQPSVLGSETTIPEEAVSGAPKINDATPPEIYLEIVQSPIEDARLISFNSFDPESGIKFTEIRFQKWFTYSTWQQIENPVLYPKGVWKFEIKTTNNEGLETTREMGELSVLFFKILPGIICLIILVAVLLVYNKKRLNQ